MILDKHLPRMTEELKTSEAHVWSADLDAPSLQKFSVVLSREEEERAMRFVDPLFCRRYRSGRTLLRLILSRYLSEEPENIPFSLGPFGKPFIAGASLHFNVSHSGAAFVVAVSRHEVGIDIEKLFDRVDVATIAEAYFTPEESNELREFPQKERLRKFFELWTRKEALLKGLGLGIAQGLEVTEEKHPSWTVGLINAPHGYVAGLALQSDDLILKTFELEAGKSYESYRA